MSMRSVWTRLCAEVREAVRDTNLAYTRLAEINRLPVQDLHVPMHWEKTWRGTRLAGSVLPEQRRGHSEL